MLNRRAQGWRFGAGESLSPWRVFERGTCLLALLSNLGGNQEAMNDTHLLALLSNLGG
jgi:hypothetical protein